MSLKNTYTLFDDVKFNTRGYFANISQIAQFSCERRRIITIHRYLTFQYFDFGLRNTSIA